MKLGAASLLAVAAIAQTFPFSVEERSEVIADLEMSAPGADWGVEGREAVLAEIRLDGGRRQHVMLHSGESRHTYSTFLGTLEPGTHRIEVSRHARFSAPGARLQARKASFRKIATRDPYFHVLAHAPILHARANTVGRFTDIPLLTYAERLPGGQLEYTVVFSNEDGGTSTRALMARWGRTTDIEYIYRVWPAEGRATIQATDHQEVEFRGRREGDHPLLIPSTQNNMVSPEGESEVVYRIPPLLADLTRHSREQVMDEHPFTYRVMAAELAREGKLRPFGAVDGEKVSDPRHYVYIEAELTNREAAVAFLLRLRGESVWRTSHLGRADYAISRSGWVRTTVELPPGTPAERISEIGFECLVADPRKARAGVCRIERVSKVFLLDAGYLPGPNLWTQSDTMEFPTGVLLVREVR